MTTQRSGTYVIAQLNEDDTNPLDVLTLDFQAVSMEHAAGAALRFQPAKQRLRFLIHGAQSANHGDDFALLPLFHDQANRPSGDGRRTGAFRFQRPTAVAFRRLIVPGSGEQSHGGSECRIKT